MTKPNLPLARHPANPIVTRADIPPVRPALVDVSSVFNPGAIKHGGRYFLLLRVQTRGRGTVLMVAESDDGDRFEVRPEVVTIEGLDEVGEHIYHVYDPRLTSIDGTIYVVFAADTDGGCRLGIAATQDLAHFKLISFGKGADSRNGVLFPQRLDGKYLRLERPNTSTLAGGVTLGSTIVLAESEDLAAWRTVGEVMTGRLHYWDELIGAGPPPVRTRDGWLCIYHGVATHFAASNIYQAGVVLLDLADPTKVLARSRCNILEPRAMYELVGQVPNVVFPTGLIVERFDDEGFADPDSAARLYYGAADTVVAQAVTTVRNLIAACHD